jgi:Uncharacterized homolog of gamma-carboxymuconolactone decarboxylase subunit
MAAVQAGKEKVMDDLKGKVAPNSRVTEEVTMTQDERPSGASTKQRVFGDQKKAPGDPFLAPFFETAVEHVWGGVWNRPGLELKYRSLVVVSVLAAIGQNEELKRHLHGALNLGWTGDELRGTAPDKRLCGISGGSRGAPRAE